jgi:hypothetical protein
MKRFVLPSVAFGLLWLTACSSDTKTAEEKPAPAAAAVVGPVAGKTAYWEMYTKAHSDFAKDIMPISLEAKEIPGIANGDGTAAMWTAEFVSDSQKERRTFTYAVSAHPPDIYKGVTIGKPLPWSGSRDITPFSMGGIQIDSEAAFKAATEDAAKFLKEHPEKNPTVVLKALTRLGGVPTWIFFWGSDKLGYRSFISAVDGKPMTGK